MNVDFFLNALGNIKPEYIEEAEFEDLPRSKNLWTGGQTGRRLSMRSFRAFAAGAAAILVIGTSFHLYLTEVQRSKSELFENNMYNGAPQAEAEGIADKSEKSTDCLQEDKESAAVEDKMQTEGCVFSEATFAELSEYYGVALIPEKLPSDLQYQNGCEAEFGFSYGEDGKLVSDANTLVFENESGSRRLRLCYSKTGSSNALEGERSVINEREVVMTYSFDENGAIVCSAAFEKDGIYYFLNGEGITEEEMIWIVEGLTFA